MTYDNSTSGVSSNGVTSYTLAHTTGTDNDRLMVVMVGINASVDRITSATYAGTSLTRADYRNVGGVGIYSYFLYAPTSGTNNLVLNFSAGTKSYVQIHTWSDASQSGVPSATAGGANGFQNTPRSDSITTPSGGLAIGAIFSADNRDFVAGATELGTAATDASGRLETQTLLDATALSWTWTGGSKNMAATVMSIAPLSTGYTLTLEAGSYAVSGQALNTLATRATTLDTGNYIWTGQDVSFAYAQPGVYRLNLDPGAYVFTGSTVLRAVSMNLESGNYTINGQEVDFTRTFPRALSLPLEAGSYSILGRNIALRWSGEPITTTRQTSLSVSIRMGL